MSLAVYGLVIELSVHADRAGETSRSDIVDFRVGRADAEDTGQDMNLSFKEESHDPDRIQGGRIHLGENRMLLDRSLENEIRAHLVKGFPDRPAVSRARGKKLNQPALAAVDRGLDQELILEGSRKLNRLLSADRVH